MGEATKFYAVKNKNKLILEKSSSGAVFDAMARYVLNNNGYVLGAAFSADYEGVEYSICSSIEELARYRGSKYSQAVFKNTLENIKKLILNSTNKIPVLITGTPCHVEGIKRYFEALKLDTSNIFFCSLICHGCSSPKIWKDYKKYKFDTDTLEAVYFKDKRKGWEKPTALAMVRGKEIDIKDYMRLFNNDMTLRPSCYECKFSTTERMCDISFGDFWGVKDSYPYFYDKKGVSLVIVHSEKGQKLFDSLRDVEYILVQKEHALQHNLVRPTSKPRGRDKFWKSYCRYSFERIVRENEKRFLWIRLRFKLCKLFRRVKK